jgi:hypothetical protein
MEERKWGGLEKLDLKSEIGQRLARRYVVEV